MTPRTALWLAGVWLLCWLAYGASGLWRER